MTDTAAFCFHYGEIDRVVPMGVGTIEPGDGIETWTFRFSTSDDHVGHTDDGGGVHAAAEFGEDGAVGAQAALDGLRKYGAEVFFVFRVRAVTDALARIEIPILA